MKLIFYAEALGLRGTTQAIYDYAHHGERLLGLDPVIAYRADHPETHSGIRGKFEARFTEVHALKGSPSEDLAHLARRTGAAGCYMLKPGEDDGFSIPGVPMCVHAVFTKWEPHGAAYAYVSDWLSRHVSGGVSPAVPHIVDLPPAEGTMRQTLGLSEDAIVLGRHGGDGTFDLAFVKEALPAILDAHPRLHLLLVNTRRDLEHPRVRYLPPISDPVAKSTFIATCDGMLHARHRGESFGLAICEFLFHGKPVLAWAGGRDRHHVDLLRAAPHALYRDAASLSRNVAAFVAGQCKQEDWAARVAPFTPEPVMARFDEVFLEALRGKGQTVPADPMSRARIRMGFRWRRMVQSLAGPTARPEKS